MILLYIINISMEEKMYLFRIHVCYRYDSLHIVVVSNIWENQVSFSYIQNETNTRRYPSQHCAILLFSAKGTWIRASP